MNNAKQIADKILNCETYDIPDIQELASAYLELEKKHRMLNNAIAIASWNINDYVKQFAKDIIEHSKSDSEITKLKEENERLNKYVISGYETVHKESLEEITRLIEENLKLEDQNKELKACIDMLTPKARSVYLNNLSASIHQTNVEAGWWTNLETGEPLERNVGELLCLVHSEVSEALEAYRKDLNDDKLPHRKGFEVELVDALIRIFDIAGKFKLDLDGALEDKLEYNAKRSDHKLEARRSQNGKKF